MIPALRNEPAAPEAPRRRFRKLRIAWSVGWGVLCVVLIALLVRSYWRCDVATDSFSPALDPITGKMGDDCAWGFTSLRGIFGVELLDMSGVAPKLTQRDFSFNTTSAADQHVPMLQSGHGSILGFQWRFLPNGSTAYVPYWFPIMLFATCAATPWMRWSKRFSLRTLLIATTLVAVVLGLAVYASR
jgi:hypothetical protein